MVSNARPAEILLVEDNPGDVRLIQEALAGSRIHHNLHAVNDGLQAMAYLRQEGPYFSEGRPDLILLDLNLPKKDGREVLAEIKGDTRWRDLPVVVLTTSKADEDVLQSYRLHANAYVAKPVDLDQFLGAVRSIEQFWLTVATLPEL